jgi:hypothetical protein
MVSCCAFLSCSDNTSTNDQSDYLLLKEQVLVLQNRVDSLIQVLSEQQRPVASQKLQKKNAKSNIKKNAIQFSLTSEGNDKEKNYNWENTATKTTPDYKPKKETQAYQVRTGATCCDGSRSYATGRGACSHHGGVCQWLYQ